MFRKNQENIDIPTRTKLLHDDILLVLYNEANVKKFQYVLTEE